MGGGGGGGGGGGVVEEGGGYGRGEGELFSLGDEDLADFLALIGPHAKRKRLDLVDGEEFDRLVKDIISTEK